MFGERRQHQRHLREASCQVRDRCGAPPRDCMIADTLLAGAWHAIDGDNATLLAGEANLLEEFPEVWRLGRRGWSDLSGM